MQVDGLALPRVGSCDLPVYRLSVTAVKLQGKSRAVASKPEDICCLELSEPVENITQNLYAETKKLRKFCSSDFSFTEFVIGNRCSNLLIVIYSLGNLVGLCQFLTFYNMQYAYITHVICFICVCTHISVL